MRILLVLLLLAVAPLAFGSVVTYDTLAEWQAHATDVHTTTFEGIAPNPPGYKAWQNTATIDDLIFTVEPAVTLVVIDPVAAPNADYGSGSIFGAVNFTNNLVNIALPGNVTALAMDLMTRNLAGATIVVNVAGENFNLTSLAQPNSVFFGITSDTPITSFSVNAGAADTNMDNIRRGTYLATSGGGDPPPIEGGDPGTGGMTETPEAGTFWLLSSSIGLLLLGWRRRDSLLDRR